MQYKTVSHLLLITLITATFSPVFAQQSNEDLIVENKRVVTDHSKNYFVFGEIRNGFDYIVDVRVSLTLYDHSHKVLRTFLANTFVSNIRPHEIVPVTYHVASGNPEKYGNTVSCVCDIDDFSFDVKWEKV